MSLREREDADDFDEYRGRPRRRFSLACRCGNDLPGTCPGPASCPMLDEDDCDEGCDSTSDAGENEC